ncbi:unnamed protein product [Symbiodinium pilosum]|uniref:START domain-containing protein n=1 Tax=Symbiodinium pilosum TaxID=2952 RepID=A0A812XJ57_SYMPI|nr:unnamed protein product [Symbiodinium pilosum]
MADGATSLPPEDMRRELQSLQKLVLAMPAEKTLQSRARSLVDRLEQLSEGKASHASQANQGSVREAAQRSVESQELMPSVKHVASFLQKPEEDVRQLAAEGTLSEELSKYPVLACDSGSAVFLRSWGEQDDAAENERCRLAVLEMTAAATNIQIITELMDRHVAADQENLNALEQQVAHTRDATQQAVINLAEAAGQKQSQWVLPSLTLTLVGGVAMLTCPVAAAASRGVFLLGSSMFSYSTLSSMQQAIINQLKEQLPRAFQPLPDQEAAMIRAGSEEACNRLQRKLDEPGRWKEESIFQRMKKTDLTSLRREVCQSFEVRSAKSDVRAEGKAYAVSFTVAMAPDQAFRLLQRFVAAGSIDPGCKVMWSRPVKAEEGPLHSIRYLAFTDWFVGRDFVCTCFCGEVPRKDVKCYAMAMTSLSDDLLKAEGLPKTTPGYGHGRVYVSGVRFTATPQGGTKVEVMADLDPNAPFVYWTRLVDKRIRNHACDVAWLLQCELDAGPGQAA